MRHMFGGDLAAWSTDLGDEATSVNGQDGRVALFIPDAPIEFWSGITGGTPYTDLLDNLGTPTTSVTTDTNGEFPQFQGPDEVWYMWADGSGDGSGPRRLIIATDLADTVAANKDSLTDLIDTATELQTLVASSLGVIEYDTVNNAWPPRPEDGRIYAWVGSTAPTIGGTGMQNNRDFWINPVPVS